MRCLLHSIVNEHPGIVFDALEVLQAQAPTPHPDQPSEITPQWCICGRCRHADRPGEVMLWPTQLHISKTSEYLTLKCNIEGLVKHTTIV